MKLCIDPGHGMSNRHAGRFDPGACHGSLREASIVLQWGHGLRKACEARGIPVWMTRHDASDPAHLLQRAPRALAQGCTHLISLHVNEAESPSANGLETLYRTDHSRLFATALHGQVLGVLARRLRDRGVKVSKGLAVLGHRGLVSVMLELGFIKHEEDMAVITDPATIETACNHLAAHLAAWRDAHR